MRNFLKTIGFAVFSVHAANASADSRFVVESDGKDTVIVFVHGVLGSAINVLQPEKQVAIHAAKVNNLNPYAYLQHIICNIVAADTDEAIDALIPWNMS